MLITDPTTGGISGVHLMEVLGKLGIADEMKSRLVPQPGGGFHAERVVKGEADLAVQAEHEIRCVKGATFLPYPAVFQRSIVFMGGLGAARRRRRRRQSLSRFHHRTGNRRRDRGALPDARLTKAATRHIPAHKKRTRALRPWCRSSQSKSTDA